MGPTSCLGILLHRNASEWKVHVQQAGDYRKHMPHRLVNSLKELIEQMPAYASMKSRLPWLIAQNPIAFPDFPFDAEIRY